MGDKQNAARVAWATIKLTQPGQRPVSLDQVATHVGLPAAEAARLLHLTWQERIDLRDGIIRLDATPAGPRRYRVRDSGRPVGSGKGCSVDMYLLALALGRPIHAEATCPATGTPVTVDITPDRVERIDPSTAVVAVVDLDADLILGPTAPTMRSTRGRRFSPPRWPRRDGWLTTPRVGLSRCGPSSPKSAGWSTAWRPHRPATSTTWARQAVAP